ncbi:flagellar biosynthesis protein FliR [Microvirga sp. 17 mud 1-3]|uniref:flagellar biosynthesis protein FliR n=1 Tax=Microvirga sp. 17 mud 1-3 TaxID=2082949 RepID=UPI000D6AAE69|nr:flagellar biosynthesis protein FliR [Microvirga sp. 17 mud 1-3]AWM85899.1 flagellar type III secretion system protein FliR [Microvirga sp. 17 mud 1-3]
MIPVTQETFLAVFLIFCRVGGCLLIVPGFSSARIPPQVRLFMALAVSLSISPLLISKFQGDLKGIAPGTTLFWIFSESVTGLLIGLLGRIFFMALQTLSTAIAMGIGFGSLAGAPMDDGESLPAIGSLIMMVATALVFMADLHWELFRGLIASYSRLPPGESFGTQLALVQITDQITATFLLALRISSPFIVYSVIVNLAVGLANKLTPTIPVYFLATPFVLLGGMLMLYFLFKEFMLLFIADFAAWLSRG